MVKCEHCQGEHDRLERFCSATGKLFAVERFFPTGMVLAGKYKLGNVIGVGGMGVVIEATHLLLQKQVAIKVLHPDTVNRAEMSERLLREARAASASGHRNIALVTDVERTDDGALYIVMERLIGRSLEEVLEEAPLPVDRAAHIICEVLAGLEAVHRRGIVHRDLKPSNVMLCTDENGDENVKILDFGISKQIGDADLTTMGKILGTPRYMPPEQARGWLDLDQRADVYAAGAILYALLTSRPPVEGSNYNAVLAAILDASRVPPSRVVQGIPEQLDRIVLRALEVNREQRYPDAVSFRRELLSYCREQASATPLLVRPDAGGSYENMATPGAERFAPSQADLVALDEHERTRLTAGASLGITQPLSDHSLARALVTGSVSVPQPIAKAETPVANLGTRQPGSDLKPPTPGPTQAETSIVSLGTRQPVSGQKPPTPGPTQPVAWDDAAPLELAEVPRQAPTVVGTIFAPERRAPRHQLRSYLAIAALLLLAGLGWLYREKLLAIISGEFTTAGSSEVIVLLDTQPAKVEIFVDGVYHPSKSLTLPRSTSRAYTIRVQAKGYVTQEKLLIPQRTQALRVVLQRRRD